MIIEDFYSNREPRVYKEYAPTLRSDREGLKVAQQDRVYSSDGVAMCHPANIPGGSYKYCMEEIMAIDEQNMNVRKETFGTITTDGSSPKHNNRVLIKQATKQGYIECEVGGVFDGSYPDSEARRGRVQENGNISPTLTADGSENLYRVEKPNERFFQQALETLQSNECEYGDTINAFNKTVDKSGVSPTLTTRPEGFKTAILPVVSRYRIRKLTPRECWRLMDFSEDDFNKAAQINSNTQLYKQAGNSIICNVLVAILGQLLPGKENVYKELSE